jgi:hypothetical protein
MSRSKLALYCPIKEELYRILLQEERFGNIFLRGEEQPGRGQGQYPAARYSWQQFGQIQRGYAPYFYGFILLRSV